jgi:hypothetical protein
MPYILSLLTASLAAAIAELLAPKGEGGRITAHIRMIAGLFLLVALLNPLAEGIRLLRDIALGDPASRVEELIPPGSGTDYSAVFGDSLTAVSSREVEAWITVQLESRFDIPPSDCRVWVFCSYEEEILTVTEARISLLGGYALRDPHPIETYFANQLNCPCFVTADTA